MRLMSFDGATTGRRCLYLGIGLVAALASGHLSAQTLPAAATPGGALPALPIEPLPGLLEDAAFPIPPSPERPLGVEDGDRIFVQDFELIGVDARPELGISPDELSALIETIRVQSQGLGAVGGDGFTEDERKEVMGFFTRVVALREFDDFLYEDYNDLVTRLREERLTRRAGLTIGQLQQVADQVTKYYKDKGFLLAQAFIPAQEVDEGKVLIEVVEGRLGNVLAQGNDGYSAETLAEPFAALIDAPVTNTGIESAILTLRDYPGLTPTAVFRPGELVGTSDLVISVQNEKSVDVAVQLDNNGSRFTGERRAVMEARMNNPTGIGDRLGVDVIQTYKPKNSLYYALSYEYPVLPGTTLVTNYSRQGFEVGGDQEAFDITGVQRSLSVAVRHSAVRSRFENLQANVGLYKSNSLVKRALVEISEDHLAYLGAGLNYDRIDTEWNGIDVAMIGTKYGLGGHFGGMDADLVTARGTPPSRRSSNGTGRFASNAFWMMEGSYTRLQNIEHDMDILFRVQGQWSNSLLTSTNQLKLGGPNSVRAYPVSEFLRDSGLFASMEWFWKAPGFSDADAFDNYKWGELLKVSFFADYGMGTLNQALTNPQQGVFQNIDIAGYGAAVHFEVPGQMLARLQASHPLSGVSPTDKRSTHWWFDVRYTF
jgi:hemolysin activation/secretion protein